MDTNDITPQQILHFWFKEVDPRQWWAVDARFDALIRERFLPLLQRASQGELFQWRATPTGRLAEIIILDQFPRNMHRNTPAAFAHDAAALVLSQEAVTRGALPALQPDERAFLLLPHMHSESRLVHAEAEHLFKQWTPQVNYDFEIQHKAIIDRFGRYPHRNNILGRPSTSEETEFLTQPGSSFQGALPDHM